MTYKLAKTSRDADPYFGAVSLLLDGTDLQDKSLDTKAITVNGDAQVSTTQSKWNRSSLYFDGTGDYLQATSSDLRLGSGEFTVEFWIYLTAANTIFLSMQSSASGWQNVDWWFTFGASRELRLTRSTGGIGSEIFGTYGSISLNTWTHIACTRDSSDNLKVFYDGVSQSLTNATYSGDLEPNATVKPLNVGGFPGWGNMLNGYIQDLRITKGVARYTANFTPPTQPFTPAAVAPDYDPYFFPNVSLLLKGDGTNGSTNIVDSSYPAKTITVGNDAQISTAESKFGGSSLYFDGTGDYLIADTDLTISNSNFTFEAWVNMDWTSQNCQIIGSSSNDFNLFIVSGSGTLKFYDGGTIYTFSNSSIPVNTWTHVAMVREGTGANETKIYVNGVNTDTVTVSKTWTTTIDIYVGRNGSAGTVYANGYIDDLRMTKGVARYTSNFTPPTKALPNY